MAQNGGSQLEDAATATAFAETIAHAIADGDSEANAEREAPRGPDRYDVQRELGEGGMGRVVEAIDRQFGRRVAIKELLRTDSSSLRARFHVEAVVTANLEHPGVTPVYERGLDEKGNPYYAMRLVRGRTLAEAIDDASDLSSRLQLVPTVVRVAQTLAYAHEHGIVHRDVKPANIVVGRHGETVLLDWGIAKVRGVASGDVLSGDDGDGEPIKSAPATRHGAVIGTPAYMAPEQATGNVAAIDERTDVFALGGLLYHVLSGRPPFQGPTMESQIERALSADYPPITELQPKAPARLVAICSRAMAAEPNDRFDSAKELAEALEGALTDALTGGGSRVLDAFANLLSVVMVVTGIASALLVWQIIPSFRALGWGVFPTIVFGVGAILLGLLDLWTKGRYQLASLLLSFTGMSFIAGALGTVIGLYVTLEAALGPGKTVNGWIVAMGSYESIGNAVVGLMMAASGLLLWGVARRRALRAQNN